MTDTQIFLIPPTFGNYTTIAYSDMYNPNKYFSFSIGRLYYIPHEQQPMNPINSLQTKKKDINNPNPSQSTISRQSTDRTLKEICLYLYYLLLLLD